MSDCVWTCQENEPIEKLQKRYFRDFDPYEKDGGGGMPHIAKKVLNTNLAIFEQHIPHFIQNEEGKIQVEESSSFTAILVNSKANEDGSYDLEDGKKYIPSGAENASTTVINVGSKEELIKTVMDIGYVTGNNTCFSSDSEYNLLVNNAAKLEVAPEA